MWRVVRELGARNRVTSAAEQQAILALAEDYEYAELAAQYPIEADPTFATLTTQVTRAEAERDAARAEVARAIAERNAARSVLLEDYIAACRECGKHNFPKVSDCDGCSSEVDNRIRTALAETAPALLAGGGAQEWRDMATCPVYDGKTYVVVVGGRAVTPTRILADGEWWRSEFRVSGTPAHWLPDPLASLPPPPVGDGG